MTKQEVIEQVKSLGLLAVIRGPSAELTVKMVSALVAGGVKGIEITYSTPNAEQVVAELAQKFGDEILLGMGTLTDPAQVNTRAPREPVSWSARSASRSWCAPWWPAGWW